MANPTAREQELLELINRMRTMPSAELALLLDSSDQGIKDALTYFKVDQSILKAQWSKLKALAPLAWSNQLNDAAAAHNQTMIKYDDQSHHVGTVTDSSGKVISDKGYEPDLAGRITAAKYAYTSGRENIYAYATSIIYAHAGFAIDWGNDANSVGGIQNPAGHRDAMMASDIREAGISILDENNDQTKVGPLVVTEDFGNRAALTGKAWLLGVAFQDANQNSWYEAGEGLKDVQVKITGINGTNFSDTITVADAGGYQELLNPGQYQVDFVRNGHIVGGGITSIDPKAPDNVKIDLVVPVMTLGADPLAVTPTILGSNLQTSGTENQVFDFSVDNSQTTAPVIAKTQMLAVNFVSVSADAAYHNYGGLYRVEDASGTVMDTDGKLYKADGSDLAGYLKAALRRSKAPNDGTELDRQDRKGDTTLRGGYEYAPFVVSNGTVDDVLNSADPAKAPHTFFNYKAVNADGFDHFVQRGINKFGCEDTFGGGDQDYNDLIFQVNAKVI
jgi:hypothetical protein